MRDIVIVGEMFFQYYAILDMICKFAYEWATWIETHLLHAIIRTNKNLTKGEVVVWSNLARKLLKCDLPGH
jgi:hypothetical protein